MKKKMKKTTNRKAGGSKATRTPAQDRRLVRLSKICAALPEIERHYTGQHAAFSVRDKKFAYFLDDHHGDGIVALACKARPGENRELVELDPARFYIPAYVGPRGWVALRLDVGDIDWAEVAEMIQVAYSLTAPKSLLK